MMETRVNTVVALCHRRHIWVSKGIKLDAELSVFPKLVCKEQLILVLAMYCSHG